MSDSEQERSNPTGISVSGHHPSLEITEEEKARLEEHVARKRRRRRWIVWTVVAVFVIGLLTSVDAIMNVRTPTGTVGWAVSLNTVPPASIPTYWVLGRSNFQGYVEARQASDRIVQQTGEQVVQDLLPYIYTPEGEAARWDALRELSEIPWTRGNDVALLIDGEETFYDPEHGIIPGIQRAEDHVLVQFYIIKADDLGNDLKDALVAKAKEGVDVYMLTDEIGSDLPEEYIREIEDAGGHFSYFNTTQGRGNRFQINFRNHRKNVVVDGKETWIGGHNVGDEYMGEDPKFGNWRDTHSHLVGPAAIAAQLNFVEDWNWAQKEILELSWPVVASEEDDVAAMILPTGPEDPREPASLAVVHAINEAQERIWIASPYFVPDEPALKALALADLRGVDVKVLIPDMPDHLLVYLNNWVFLDTLKDTGVEIYRYTDGFMHAKTILVDDELSMVGTKNLDNRSFRINFEITNTILDEDFALEMEQMFEDDFARSRIMESDEYDQKPFWFQLLARTARMTAPLQ